MYDRLMSLGNFCEPAYQIRRFTKIDSAQYFDWLITPIEGVIQTIATNFEQVFQRGRVTVTGDGKQVIDRSNQTIFLHQFSKTEAKIFSQEIVDREFDAQREKIEFLARRWRSTVAAETVLFVWRANPSADQVCRLMDALQAAQPGRPPSLLIARTVPPPDPPARPGAREAVIALAPPGPNSWMGLDAAWSEVLGGIDVKRLQPAP